MEGYSNIPKKFIRQVAKVNKIKHRGKDILDIISEIEGAGLRGQLEYLNNQCRFSERNLTLIKPTQSFPTKSSSAEKFINTIIKEKYINNNQLGTEWEPHLKKDLQLCSVYMDGSDVYIKIVEGKTTYKKRGYSSYPEMYAAFTSVVIHFSDQVIELRCSYTDRKEISNFIMKLIGFGTPYDWDPITIVSKDEAKRICSLLSAGVSSTQIEIPSTVGSVRLNGKKNVNLREDEWFSKITSAINNLGLSVEKVTDETCFFKYIDPISKIEIDVSFEVNLANGGFKFTSEVIEKIYEHVLEAFIKICYLEKSPESAASSE